MNRTCLIVSLLCFISCGSSDVEDSENGPETDSLQLASTIESADQPDYCNASILTGAQQTELYIPLLSGKNVAVVANPSSMIGETHLVDSLVRSGIQITKVFSPEHGFRGDADAGEEVEDGIDKKTGLKVFSLYGDAKRPDLELLKDIDVIVFDIQDVGARFYTYISTLTYVMDAAAEAGIEMLVLDRPNPNGHYVAGPVLDKKFSSFVGMHAVPVVHGMTIGEYAKMVDTEKWNPFQLRDKLKIIPCVGWDHTMFYELPVAPSPNLSTMRAIYLYPSLCLFEGTVVSVGRGTDKPFQQIGHPAYHPSNIEFLISFVPEPNAAAAHPLLEGEPCYGFSFDQLSLDSLRSFGFQISDLIEFYTILKNKTTFFLKSGFINQLAGTDQLRKQIEAGKTAGEIEAGWQEGIENFKLMRKKYLLYKDFE